MQCVRQLPCQVVCVLNSRVHTKSPRWREPVCRIPRQEDVANTKPASPVQSPSESCLQLNVTVPAMYTLLALTCGAVLQSHVQTWSEQLGQQDTAKCLCGGSNVGEVIAKRPHRSPALARVTRTPPQHRLWVSHACRLYGSDACIIFPDGHSIPGVTVTQPKAPGGPRG